jgi:predicted nucleotidyltransferase component of viral defense system
MLSYENQAHNIKVEISRRDFDSSYELKNYLGTSMLVMKLEDMVAHKLVAMSERMHRTSRDIYDVWFFMRKIYPINQTIIEQRSGLTFEQFVAKCISQLDEINNKQILNGVGELLSENQKDWVRDHLKNDVIALMKIRFLKT